MSSLRARVLASVLALAAAGMIAVAAVTYAEQRSFLYSRADQQARSAVGAISRVLDNAGLRPPGFAPGGEGGGGFGGGPGGHGGGPVLPPGTYGQRRGASGEVIGSRQIAYSSSEPVPAPPKLPADVPLETIFEVPSTSSSGPHYRVYAQGDPEDTGVTIAAVPLTDVEQTLGRLLLVEGLVIGGVLLLLGVSAFFVVRLGPAPAEPHRGHRRADRRRRPLATGEPRDHEDRGRPPRPGPERDARPPRAGVRGAHRQRRAAPPVPRRRLARAAHAARLDPGLRRAVPARGGPRPRGHRERDAPHRGGVEAHGRARRGPAGARAPGRAARARARRASTSRPWRATPCTTRALARPSGRSR